MKWEYKKQSEKTGRVVAMLIVYWVGMYIGLGMSRKE